MPRGGIGTGTIALAGNGSLRHLAGVEFGGQYPNAELAYIDWYGHARDVVTDLHENRDELTGADRSPAQGDHDHALTRPGDS